MTNDDHHTPYKPLGSQLKRLRQRVRESVAEVSGAIEIDEAMLNRIERGQERPSEDILLLLITHFSMQDDEAVKLWDLAGYDQSTPHIKMDEDSLSGNRPLVMVMSLDSRIMYSDSVQIVANQNGIVMNFLQSPAGAYPAQTVSRIGMSREQATKLLQVLNQTLIQSEKAMKQTKSLPTRNHQPKRKQDSN